MASTPPGFSYFFPLSGSIVGNHHCSQFLYACHGFDHKSSCFHGKHFTSYRYYLHIHKYFLVIIDVTVISFLLAFNNVEKWYAFCMVVFHSSALPNFIWLVCFYSIWWCCKHFFNIENCIISDFLPSILNMFYFFFLPNWTSKCFQENIE